MSNRPEQGGQRASRGFRLSGLGQTTGNGGTVLIPVLPAATIDEIVANLEPARGRVVELLVPNNTRALQSLAGCELLRNAAAERGIHLTLFTADDQTIAAATRAKVDTVSVGGSIAAPSDARPPISRPPTVPVAPAVPPIRGSAAPPSRPKDARPAPTRGADPAPPARRVAPSSSAVPQPEDDHFLSGLAAFDRQHVGRPAPAGETVRSAEGAVLFDAPGDLGVRRPAGQDQQAWATAFDDMGETMAAEPAPVRRQRRQTDRAAAAPASGGDGRGGVLGALTSVLPRRQPAPRRTSGPDAGRTSAPKRGDAGRSAQPSRSRRWLLLPLLLLGLVAMAVLVWIGLRNAGVAPGAATIALTPAAPSGEVRSYSGVTVPVRSTPPADAASPDVQAILLEQPVSVTVAGSAISTTLTPATRARGVLVLRNRSTQPVTVRAGTVLPAPNGAQFTVDQNVTVGAAVSTPDSITFGRAQVPVTATVPGSVGNIAAGTITEIQGIGGNLRVEHGAFSGGTDQPVSIVRPEDVNRVLPEALSQLHGAGMQALNTRLAEQPALALSAETVTPTLEMLQRLEGVQYGTFPPIGSVAADQTFRLELRTTFRAVAEPSGQPLAQQLPQAVRNQLQATGQLTNDGELEITRWSVAPAGLLVDAALRPSVEVPPLPEDFLAEVQQRLAGRPREDAVTFLQGLVEEGRIAAFAPLPADWTTVPEQVRVVQASR